MLLRFKDLRDGVVMNLTCGFYGMSYMNVNDYLINLKACAFVSIILSLPTSIVNSSLIIVLAKNKDRSRPSNIFLFNLVITDCLCGFISQPVHAVLFYKLSNGEDPCSFSLVLVPIAYILGIASFLAITLIALERYTAIFYPFFYERTVSFRSVIITIITIWVLSAISIIHPVVKKDQTVLIGIAITIGVVGSSVNIYCYCKILNFARRVRKEISSTMQRYCQQDAEKRQRESSLALTGGLILISMCVCYLPFFVISGMKAAGFESSVFKYLRCWEWNLVNGNSLLNACITCYQLSYLRNEIFRLWRCSKCNSTGA